MYMSEDIIRKSESDLLSMAINKIISSEVLEKDMSDVLPLIGDLTDSNKIYYGKASILFVDMRESTKLPEKFSKTQLVKLYRSYIRSVVQAIRYSGGVVRDFMGDGVLAVFVDNEDGNSEDRAVRAARYITTVIDKLLNPVLEQEIKHRVSCGIGIHTGEISISKVGMRGKEQCDDEDNEFGIAWIGNSTNLACKFSGAVNCGTIFISASTYSALSNIDGKQMWEKVQIFKGGNVLDGYIAKQYYLQTEDNFESYPAENSLETLNLADELKKEYNKHITNIEIRVAELGKKEQTLQVKENQLNYKIAEINQKSKENISKEQAINNREHQFYCDVLHSGYCKAAYVREMGRDFWEENLEAALSTGIKIGKKGHEVKQEISYAMVSIYEDLELYDKAYDFLVEQATGYSWLLLSTVQNIVSKVRYCDRLKTALYIRLEKDDLSVEDRLEFTRIKDWLEFEYKG